MGRHPGDLLGVWQLGESMLTLFQQTVAACLHKSCRRTGSISRPAGQRRTRIDEDATQIGWVV